MAAEPVQVSIDIDASPAQLYALVADLPTMGRYSPENQGGTWLDGATHPAVGARFRGRNRNRLFRWATVCTITSAQPGRKLSWDVHHLGLPVSAWRYDFRPRDGGGCTVVESAEDRRWPVFKLLAPLGTGVIDRAKRNRATMRQTLQRLKEAAEAD